MPSTWILKSVSGDSQEATALRSLLKAQWGEIDGFEQESGLSLPDPIVCMDADDIVGGLAFTSHPDPSSNRPSIWINAVLVLEAYRRQGIAKHLVLEAEQIARARGIDTLHTLTDVPRLYTALDWVVVSFRDAESICRRLL